MKISRLPGKQILFFALFFWAGTALTAANPFWVDIETGALFTGYNNVQIPADTGTRFSLADDLDPDTVWFYRLQAGADFDRHSVSVLYAPLKVKSSGTAAKDISFNGETFEAGSRLEAVYLFNSYRLTWAYTIAQTERFRFKAGITGKIRDAYISLESEDKEAKRSNLGVVPLIHLGFMLNLSPSFSLMIEGDGLAAPQGRAEDFLAAFIYRPEDNLELRIGYRILEGGSDGGGEVYTFSMFHYISAGLRYKL